MKNRSIFGWMIVVWLCAGMLGSALAQQRDIYRFNFSVRTENQSVWAPGQGRLDYEYFLGTTFNSHDSFSGYFNFFGDTGIGGEAGISGKIGLQFSAWADGGSVDIEYPFTLELGVPPREALLPGGPVVITTAFKRNGTASLLGRSPDANVTLDAIIQARPVLSLTGKFAGDTIFSGSLIPRSLRNIDWSFNLFDLQSVLGVNQDRTIDLIPRFSGLLTAEIHKPVFSVSASNGSTNPMLTQISGTGSDRMFTLTGDLTAAVIYLIQTATGSPPFNILNQSATINLFDGFQLSGGYNIAQATIRGVLGVRQDLSFQPKPKIRFSRSDGTVLGEVEAGQPIQLQMPTNGPLDIKVTVIMDGNNQFNNKLYLTLGGGFYFLPLSISGSAQIGSLSLGSFTLEPFDTYALEASRPFQVFTRQFALQGFNQPETNPIPVHASNDTTPGIFYSVNFPGDTFARFGDTQAVLKIEGRPIGYLASGAQIYVNNIAIPTTYNAAQNLLTATLSRPTHDSILNTVSLDGYPVFARVPGKPDSNIVRFPVGYRLPKIHSVLSGSQQFTTYVVGSRGDNDLPITVTSDGPATFTQGLSVVYWNDQPLETTYPAPWDGNALDAVVPYALLNKGGPVDITVVTPLPGGGVSNAKSIYIVYPPPYFDDNSQNRLNPRSGYAVAAEGVAITVKGSGFIKGDSPETASVVIFKPVGSANFVDLQTEYVNGGTLIAMIPASLLQTAGNAEVDVRNPATPGFQFTGGTETFTVLNPVSIVHRCDPPYVQRGSATQTIRVLGEGFKNFMQVHFNNAPRATTFVSPNELRFTVNTNEMTAGRVYSVKVSSPQPSPFTTQFSNPETFTVRNPKPTLTSLSPNTRAAFSGGFTLNVYGTGFESSAQAYINGLPRYTVQLSSTELLVSVQGSDLLFPGSVQIQVENAPSELSNALSLTVIEPSTIFVTPTGNDVNNGLSWNAPKRTIQNAINTATAGMQVWVKAGVYNERITMKNRVPVFGGFAGTETSRWQRTTAAGESIIDGQAGGRVVTFPAGIGNDTLIDNFTIRNGRSDSGSGIYAVGTSGNTCSPIISNCVLVNNQTSGTGVIGSTITHAFGSPEFLNNLIIRNTSTNATIYLVNSSAKFINNTIANNTSTDSSAGAALYASSGTNILLANNIFHKQSGGPLIEKRSDGGITMRNNCVNGSPNFRNMQPSETDIIEDPLFVNDGQDNYHLKPNSPCFDRGDNADAAKILQDFDLLDRIFGEKIDLGADEINALTPTSLSSPNKTGQVGSSVPLEAILRRQPENTALNGQRVLFSVNGNSVGDALTNSQGNAVYSYHIPVTTAAGTYPIQAVFPGYRGYNSSQVSATLIVNKANTTLAIPNVSASLGESSTITARLTYGASIPLEGKMVTLRLSGNTLGTVVTNANGEAMVNYTPGFGTPRGNQPITAEFAGDVSFNASDGSGTLTVLNAPPTATLAGAMLRFNGANNFAQLSGYGLTVPTGEMTIEFWQKVDAARPQSPFTIGILGSNRISMHTPWSDGVIYWDFGSIFNGGRLSYTPTQNIVGTWQHFAFVVSQSGNFMRIYRNGVLEAQKTGMTPYTRGNVPLVIGGNGYQGMLDEVRVWNYARSGEEINTHFEATLKGSEVGLIGYWRMDEGSGLTLNDSTNAGSHATLSGVPDWLASDAPVFRVITSGGQPRAFQLKGFDLNQDPLTYAVVTPPNNGGLSGVAPHMLYVPQVIGPQAFTFKANDGAVDSVPASATLQALNRPVAGLAGAMLRLDGVDDRVEIAHRAELNAYPLTLSAWVRTTHNSATERAIINKYSVGSTNGYQMFLRNGRLRAWHFRNGSSYIWDGGSGMDGGFIADGQWHHVAMVVDENGGRLYVDGELKASRAWTGTPGASTTTQPLIIGHYPPLNDGFFPGDIDEVRIWNRALMQTELQRDLRASLKGDEPNLIGYYRLDEGTGSVAHDSSNSAAHGALQNSPRWLASDAPIDTINLWLGTARALTLGAFDYQNRAISYAIASQPSKGTFSGTAPNLTFTPSQSGADGFNYFAQVGNGLNSELARVNLNIYVPGDVNGDGCANDNDLLEVLFNFGQSGTDLPADLNRDGIVNDNDLLEVLFNFGAGC